MKRVGETYVIRSVVHNPGCTLGSPGEFLKLWMLRLHPRQIELGSLEVGPEDWKVLEAPWEISVISKTENY